MLLTIGTNIERLVLWVHLEGITYFSKVEYAQSGVRVLLTIVGLEKHNVWDGSLSDGKISSMNSLVFMIFSQVFIIFQLKVENPLHFSGQ